MSDDKIDALYSIALTNQLLEAGGKLEKLRKVKISSNEEIFELVVMTDKILINSFN